MAQKLPLLGGKAFIGHRPCALSAPLRSTLQQRCAFVAMAKPTKAAEFRDLSNEAIEKEIYDCQRALLDQRIAQGSRKPFKADQFQWNKNKIAQLKTVLREREIEKGINRRESRKIEKRKKIAAGFAQY